MKKNINKKKLLIIVLITVVVAIAAVVIINIVKEHLEPTKPQDEIAEIIPLPETTYSNMEVRNVQMEYLKDNDETMITMEIHNTSENKIEQKQNVDVLWIGPDEDIIGQITTQIIALDVGEQYDISVILKGDLTSTTQIKLMKK